MKRTINIEITVDSETALVEAFKAYENENEVFESEISICDATAKFYMLLGLLID